MRHQILHLRMIFLVSQSAALRFLHNSIGHGVRIVFFQAGGKAEHFRLIMSAEGNNLCHLRRGIGQCAGLVEHDGIRFG